MSVKTLRPLFCFKNAGGFLRGKLGSPVPRRSFFNKAEGEEGLKENGRCRVAELGFRLFV